MSSLRGRLLLGAGIGVALALVASGALVYALSRASLYDQFDEALEARARALAALVELDGTTLEVDIDPLTGTTTSTKTGATEVPLGASAPGQRDYFELWSSGANLVRSQSLGTANLVPAIGLTSITLPDGSRGRQITLQFLPRREPNQDATVPLPEVVLVLARGTASVDDTIGWVATVLIGIGGFGMLLALAILAVVIRVGLSPVRTLASEIAAIDIASLTKRLDAADAPAELRGVVTRLNELLERLALAFERERDLTAELAHELRTPLAGIRSTIEVALDRERPAERYRASLVDVLAITHDTERLVTAMLTLARLDAGSARAGVEAVDVDELVRGALDLVAARCTERNIVLTTRLPPVTIATDAAMLRAIVHNLLDNAVSYVDTAGTIDVWLTTERIVISNSGCALASTDVARVFERFWRGDAARATGVHAGLGLALCQKLVALLGGTIAIEIKNRWFEATVTWPPR